MKGKANNADAFWVSESYWGINLQDECESDAG
jgi:hypothetical protein